MADKQTPGNDITQIRDLIFGEQIRVYDRKFEQMAKELDALRKQLDEQKRDHSGQFGQLSAKLSELDKSSGRQLEQTAQDIRNELTRLRDELNRSIELLQNDKTDRLVLGNSLVELGLKLKGEDILQQIRDQNDQRDKG